MRPIFFWCILLLTTFSFAQKRISGQVLHAYTKEPIEGALVELEGKSVVRIITNSEGGFTIPLSTQGDTFQLRIGGIGFNQNSYSYSSDNTTENLIYYLEPREIRLKEINVEGYREPLSTSLDTEYIPETLLASFGSIFLAFTSSIYWLTSMRLSK